MRLICKLFVFLLVAAAVCAATDPQSTSNVFWAPEALASGSPCLFQLKTLGTPSSVTGNWQGQTLTFASSDDRHKWFALAGVDVETKPGTYKLEVTVTMPGGQVERLERDVTINAASYKTEVLRVPQKFVKPTPQAMVQIEADRKLKKAAFDHQIAVAEWSGKFDVPVGTKASEGFGTRRTFNGELASIHKGMDYHAASGTPVHAANDGEVVLAAPLYYEGNCVVINHGQQFMTIYMHLSHLAVKEGDKVQKGQEIGLSGATGRATGPHLHIAVRWQNAYLDPAQLWLLPLPSLAQTKDTLSAR